MARITNMQPRSGKALPLLLALALAVASCTVVDVDARSLRTPGAAQAGTVDVQDGVQGEWFHAATDHYVLLGRPGGSHVYRLDVEDLDAGSKDIPGSVLESISASRDTAVVVWKNNSRPLWVECEGDASSPDGGAAREAVVQVSPDREHVAALLTGQEDAGSTVLSLRCGEAPKIDFHRTGPLPTIQTTNRHVWFLSGNTGEPFGFDGGSSTKTATAAAPASAERHFDSDGESLTLFSSAENTQQALRLNKPVKLATVAWGLDAGSFDLDASAPLSADSFSDAASLVPLRPRALTVRVARDQTAAVTVMSDHTLTVVETGHTRSLNPRLGALEAVVSDECESADDASALRHKVAAFVPNGTQIWTQGPHHPGGITLTLARPVTDVVSGPCDAPLIVLHPTGYTSIQGDTARLAPDELPVLGVVHSLAKESDGGVLTWLALQDVFGKQHQIHMLPGGGASNLPTERFPLDGVPVALGVVGSSAYTVIDALDGNFVLLSQGGAALAVPGFDLVGRCSKHDPRPGDAGQDATGATPCPR